MQRGRPEKLECWANTSPTQAIKVKRVQHKPDMTEVASTKDGVCSLQQVISPALNQNVRPSHVCNARDGSCFLACPIRSLFKTSAASCPPPVPARDDDFNGEGRRYRVGECRTLPAVAVQMGSTSGLTLLDGEGRASGQRQVAQLYKRSKMVPRMHTSRAFFAASPTYHTRSISSTIHTC